MIRLLKWFALLASIVVFAACGGGAAPTVAPAAIATLAPTQVVLAPTTVPTTAPTLAPTDTAVPTKLPSETATLAPAATSTTEPTVTSSPIANQSSENCVACHTAQAKLQELAVDKTAKSEATSGEG